MNLTLEKFMGLAITAVLISGLLFGAATVMLKDESSKYKNHLNDNLNTLIEIQTNE